MCAGCSVWSSGVLRGGFLPGRRFCAASRQRWFWWSVEKEGRLKSQRIQDCAGKLCKWRQQSRPGAGTATWRCGVAGAPASVNTRGQVANAQETPRGKDLVRRSFMTDTSDSKVKEEAQLDMLQREHTGYRWTPRATGTTRRS